jgi:hypothetical protein
MYTANVKVKRHRIVAAKFICGVSSVLMINNDSFRKRPSHTLCIPHTRTMRVLRQTLIINRTNLSLLVMEKQCVFCKVESALLTYISDFKSSTHHFLQSICCVFSGRSNSLGTKRPGRVDLTRTEFVKSLSQCQ